MLKHKSAQVECQSCHDHGYVQLLLGGSETCFECQGSKKWRMLPSEKKVKLYSVQLK
ncbi:YuiA family protein [Bacillus horti]|uniref:DnaJ-class molecular chaperone n=1 Tax=Caldalkalibacillus horti TaxID=77523 RepID=A0ABT9VTT9_9BACI|nr:YuiA family protein [Bacillus horti]MDQ0164392.1 DnaJ-class molecular chaperone [Bacillus horti]